LLEHLAFSGSRHFPDNSLLSHLESLGMEIGKDINAWTGPAETIFALSFADARKNAEVLGFRILSDMACGLSLSPEQIPREKSVVLEEMRLKETASSVWEQKMLEVMFPHIPGFKRNPLGDPHTLKQIDRTALLSFYDTWYRPHNAILFVAGNLDPALSKQRIEDAFGRWKAASSRRSTDRFTAVKGPETAQAFILHDDSLTESRVDLFSFQPIHPITRVRDFSNRLMAELALKIVSMRLKAKTYGPDGIFYSAHAGFMDFHHAGLQLYASAGCRPSDMEESLTVLLKEFKRFRKFGPSLQEIETVGQSLLMEAEQRSTQTPSKLMKLLMREMIRAALTDSIFLSPNQSLDLNRWLLPGISIAGLRDFTKRCFAPHELTLLLSTPLMPKDEFTLKPGGILDLLNQIECERAMEPEDRPIQAVLGCPTHRRGKIIERAEEPDLEILSITFQNGVRLHLRSMNEFKNQVLIRILLQGGRNNESASERGLTDAAALSFSRPATRQHNSRELYRFLQSNRITVKTKVLEDGVLVAIQAPKDRLEPCCRLAHQLLTEPNVEEMILTRWQESVIRGISGEQNSMDRAVRDLFRKKLSGYDPRFDPLTVEQAAVIDREQAQAWLMRLVRRAPVEISIVGDEKRSTALELAEQYLGTLGSRPRQDPDLEKRCRLRPMIGPQVHTLIVSSESSMARTFMGWRAPPWQAVQERRMFHLVAPMLNSRLKRMLRQEQGRVYDLYCDMQASKAYPSFSWIGASFCTAPADAETAAEQARRAMEAFAAVGPEENELAVAKRRMTLRVLENQKKTAYWSNILSELDYHQGGSKNIRDVCEGYRTLTKEGISQAMRQYFTNLNRWQFIVASETV
jgi:zinc protease